MSGRARNELAEFIDYLKPSLDQHPIRRVLYGYENPIQLWLCNGDARPTFPEMKFQGQVACLVASSKKVLALRVSYEGDRVIDAGCEEFGPPSILQVDYAQYKAEADRQSQKMMTIKDAKRKAKKARRR